MLDKTMLFQIFFIIGGYFIGGIMFSELLPRIFMKKDICALSDDNNPGASNVFKHCGIVMGIVCLLLDMLKGAIPIFTYTMTFEYDSFLFSLVMIAPVLGHAMSPYYHFRGGKCIATVAGEAIALLPITRVGLILVVSYIVFSLIIKIPEHRIRSIITFSIFGVLSLPILIMEGHIACGIGCFIISAIVVIKHIRNIPREEAEKIESTE